MSCFKTSVKKGN